MRCADFGPTPGQATELVDELLHRLGVDRHQPAPKTSPSPASGPIASRWISSSWRVHVVQGGDDEVLEHGDVVGIDHLRDRSTRRAPDRCRWCAPAPRHRRRPLRSHARPRPAAPPSSAGPARAGRRARRATPAPRSGRPIGVLMLSSSSTSSSTPAAYGPVAAYSSTSSAPGNASARRSTPDAGQRARPRGRGRRRARRRGCGSGARGRRGGGVDGEPRPGRDVRSGRRAPARPPGAAARASRPGAPRDGEHDRVAPSTSKRPSRNMPFASRPSGPSTTLGHAAWSSVRRWAPRPAAAGPASERRRHRRPPPPSWWAGRGRPSVPRWPSSRARRAAGARRRPWPAPAERRRRGHPRRRGGGRCVGGARRRRERRWRRRRGLAALEPLEPFEDGVEGPVGVGPAQPHERDLEDDPRIGLLGQLHERFAEHLEGAGEAGGAELARRAPPPWRGRRPGGGDRVPSSRRGTRRGGGR